MARLLERCLQDSRRSRRVPRRGGLAPLGSGAAVSPAEGNDGIPISLAVVLIETGARLGIQLEGVGFPGHFLVRLADPRHPLLIDPFFGGRVLGEDALLERYRALGAAAARGVPPEALEPTPKPAILARMLRNLLRIYDRSSSALMPRRVGRIRHRSLTERAISDVAASCQRGQRRPTRATTAPRPMRVARLTPALARRQTTSGAAQDPLCQER